MSASEFDRLKIQKDATIARDSDFVFEIAINALRNGAPGLSDSIRQGIARGIAARVAVSMEKLRFELKAVRNELKIADGEIERLNRLQAEL